MVASFVIVLSACTPSTTPVSVRPSKGAYIPFRDGEESKVLLVSSNLRYGTFDKDVTFPVGDAQAVKGDRAIIISGEIRNDYEVDYFISITADVYNSGDEKIGIILSPGAPAPGFSLIFIKRASNSSFEIWVKYEQQDVTRYELFIAYPPSAFPPP
jgi:hypothetical protein